VIELSESDSEDARSERGVGSQPVRFSLPGRVTAAVFVLVAAMAAIATLASTYLPLQPWVIFLMTLAVGLALGAWLVNRVLRPLTQTLSGLSDGIRSFYDHDFSLRLPSHRRDELGELAFLYNQVGEVLSQERKEVRERELLLQTALNRSPTAIILVNAMDRVIFSNRQARSLFFGGSKLEGLAFEEIRQGCPDQMKEVLSSDSDGIFSVPGEENTETYHLSQRTFLINRRRHTLVLLRRLTHDLDRQEAEIWKKVIRVISHELRNSLAPVSSFVHSAKKMSQDPLHAERTQEVFVAIEERLDHLTRFIEGYARYARLPKPQKEEVSWADFVGGLEGVPEFALIGRLPARPGHFDPAQMRRVLINLLRNAEEAAHHSGSVELRIKDTGEGGTFLQVLDRGRGMDEKAMENALLPFYSTKQTGTGLGLPLCREILEAHGGRISFQSREGGGTIVTCWLPSL
jgi:two-component system nitrogen regulation sensor histidine kinase NtrY